MSSSLHYRHSENGNFSPTSMSTAVDPVLMNGQEPGMHYGGVERGFQSRNMSKTIPREEIPEWMKNETDAEILTGYRRLQSTWKGCLYSVFGYLHNETVNIHSHFWGGLFFVYLLATVKPDLLTTHSTSWIDSALFMFFFASVCVCMFSSALFHTAICHSREVCVRCHAGDYVGIMVLNLGSHYPLIFYGFACQPQYQIIYMVGVTLANMAGAYVVLDPEYSKPTHMGARTAIFLALGFFSFFPIGHWIYLYGATTTFVAMGTRWFILSGSFYVWGALTYANRIPERFSPGKCDYFFTSHQIFHFCVIVGAYLHYVFISIELDHYHAQNCR